MSLPFDQGVSAFWSASDTDFKNLSLGVSTFWSASDTYFKNLSLVVSLFIRVSLPLGVFTYWSGCHCLLISKWHWLQKPKFKLSLAQVVSTFWSASNTDMKNLCLGVYTIWGVCLYLWVSPLFHQGVSAFWSASDNDFKNLSPNFRMWWVVSAIWSARDILLQKAVQELSPPFGRESPLWVLQLFDQDVSTIWSASDTDFKNLSSNFHWGVVSTFWSASDNDFKNLSLDISTFWSGCLHLWVHLLFDQGLSTFGCVCFLIRVSPLFDQQVTLTSKT